MGSQTCPACGASLLPDADVCAACAFRLAAAETDSTQSAPFGGLSFPSRLGSYKILERIAEGGMGVVYLAEQERPFRRRVALKVIKFGMDTPQVVARFEAERQALALMNHPCIAEVYDAGTSDDGRLYFAMEFVPGIAITDYCDKHRLSTAARLDLFVQVCGAVQHAHQKGVIHRDIKPSNVLVAVQDGQPRPKVIDFGVAKAIHQRLTEKTVFTQYGLLIGTPAYMSPEQAERGGLDVDTTTDIYSLGVLLYELLIGALPFDAEVLRQAGYAEIQRIIREQEPLRPSARLNSRPETGGTVAAQRRTELATLTRELKGDLDWITLKAMDKDRTRRYSSASELAADVSRHLDKEPVLARPASVVYRARKFARRHRAAVVAGSLSIAALATAFVLSTVLYIRSERARSQAEWLAYVAAIAAADVHISTVESASGQGPPRNVAASEAERRLLQAPERLRNWEWHHSAARLDGSAAALWGSIGPSTANPPSRANPVKDRGSHYRGALGLSDNNSRIFWSTGEGVHAWDLTAFRLVSAWPAYGWVAALAGDGSKVLSFNWRQDRPWRVIATETGSVVSALGIDAADVGLAVFSPTGERIAVAGLDGAVTVWVTRTGESVRTTHLPGSVIRIGFGDDEQSLVLISRTAIFLWRFLDGEELLETPISSPGLVAADVAAQGNAVVTADESGDLRLWQLPSAQSRVIGRHPGATAIAIAPNAQGLASSGGSHIRLWALTARADPTTFTWFDDEPADALVFTRDDRRLVAASKRGVLRVWEVPFHGASAARLKEGYPINQETSANGRFMASRVVPFRRVESPGLAPQPTPEESAPWKLIDLQNSRIEDLPLAPSVVSMVAVNDDGTRLAFAERDGTIKVMRGTRGESASVLGRAEGVVRALTIDSQGNRVAAAWSTPTGQEETRAASVSTTDGAGNRVTASWSGIVPDDVGSQLQVFDVDTRRVLVSTASHMPRRLVFDSRGNRLMVLPLVQGVGTARGSRCSHPIDVWDLSRALIRFSVADCGPAIFAGPRLVTGATSERGIHIWDATTGQLKAESPDARDVRSLASTADGTRIASASAYHIGIFDATTGSLVLTIPTPASGELRFSEDGSLVSLSRLLSERTWKQSPYDLAARALARQLLPTDTVRPTRDIRLADEVVDELRANHDLSADFRRAVIEEVQRVGDRDLNGLCRASRDIVLRNEDTATNQRALKMAGIVARLAPWSAHCVGVLGMAKFRTGDHAGALETLAAAAELRGDPGVPVDELAFRAMALYRLGRASEAARVVYTLEASAKADAVGGDLSGVIVELSALAGPSR